MTAIARSKIVLDALMDKVIPAEVCLKMVNRVLLTNGTDTKDMSDELKAKAFLNGVKDVIKNYNVSAAITEAQKANKTAEDTAIADVDVDFD